MYKTTELQWRAKGRQHTKNIFKQKLRHYLEIGSHWGRQMIITGKAVCRRKFLFVHKLKSWMGINGILKWIAESATSFIYCTMYIPFSFICAPFSYSDSQTRSTLPLFIVKNHCHRTFNISNYPCYKMRNHRILHDDFIWSAVNQLASHESKKGQVIAVYQAMAIDLLYFSGGVSLPKME